MYAGEIFSCSGSFIASKAIKPIIIRIGGDPARILGRRTASEDISIVVRTSEVVAADKTDPLN
jgi:hypothetical protein